MSKKTLIVLVGGPCSGKSSVGKIAAEHLIAKYISSGDIARDMAKNDDNIQNDLNGGKLAPESRMREAIKDHLWKHFYKRDENLVILDGFPRFGDQADWLNYEFYGIDIRYVLIHAPSHILRCRAKNRNRSDDSSFEQRLDYYRKVTYKELYDHVDTIINTEEITIEKCATILENYVKEVIDSAKDS